MEELKKSAVFLVESFYLTIVAMVSAILPSGVLPRKNVRGEKVLITGAGSGIGRGLALKFARLGAKVIVWDVNDEGSRKTLELIEDEGFEATSYHVDLSSSTEINETAKNVGNVDILINNAGIAEAKLMTMNTEAMIEKTFAINTKALFYTTQNFLPTMLHKNHGHIVTIASMAGKIASAGLSVYTASKHAAVGFHGSLTDELSVLGTTGIHTTLVCPYYVRTAMFDAPEISGTAILPILEVDYVADRIVEAILTNTEHLCTPRASYFIAFLINIMPSSVWRLITSASGISKHLEEAQK